MSLGSNVIPAWLIQHSIEEKEEKNMSNNTINDQMIEAHETSVNGMRSEDVEAFIRKTLKDKDRDDKERNELVQTEQDVGGIPL